VTVQHSDSPRALILWTIWMVVLTGLVLWTAYIVRGALLLIYISALFAIGFSPMIRLIERQRMLPMWSRRLPRWGAILTLYVGMLSAIFALAMMVFPPLVRQARALYEDLPNLFDRAQQFLISKGLLQEHITLRQAVEYAPAGGGDAVTAVVNAVVGLIGGVFGFITILILTFYLLVDSASLFETVLRLFPRRRRARVAAMARDITIKLSAWLTGQLLLGAIIGATAAIGLALLGVPYFYVLALIAGIGELIPVVGPILAAIPAIAVALSVSPEKALAVAIFFLIQQQFENHVLVPKVMERQVGVSAVTVIVALLIGGSLLGIVGAILAVPTAAIIQVVLNEILEKEDQAADQAAHRGAVAGN
jgi:predicted PurR-regulated permease PerM